MNFLIDNQLPPALARLIQNELNAKAVHVADLKLCDASDEEIWRYALAHDSIIISKDEDFSHLHSRQPTARLIWLRVGNCRRSFLLNVFRTWPRIIARLASGDTFIEIR